MLKIIPNLIVAKSDSNRSYKLLLLFDRFTGFDDLEFFEKTATRVVAEALGEEYTSLVEPTPYFMDFMR